MGKESCLECEGVRCRGRGGRGGRGGREASHEITLLGLQTQCDDKVSHENNVDVFAQSDATLD